VHKLEGFRTQRYFFVRAGESMSRDFHDWSDLFRHSMACGIALSCLLFGGPDRAQTQSAARIFAGYYESWLANAKVDGSIDSMLAGLPASINVVDLAFMRPDARYEGNLDLSHTGLEFPYDGKVLANSIEQLRKRNPGTKILISVGGQADRQWDHFAPAAIARFVADFRLDGVDLDFEPDSPDCQQTAGKVVCKTDGLLARSVEALRFFLPRPAIISLAGLSTGAFGEGPWESSQPKGGAAYGILLDFLQDPEALSQIDLLSIMAYDAGSGYDPIEGYSAYRNYFGGPILIGFTPPPEDWGDHSYSSDEVRAVLQKTIARGAAGAMLFSLRKSPQRAGDGLNLLVDPISATLASDGPVPGGASSQEGCSSAAPFC
jgi:chitinase